MFGLGFFEIMIIFLAVIIFVNPRDLPAFFRKTGKLYQQIREIRNNSFRYFKEIEKEIEKPVLEETAKSKRGHRSPEDEKPEISSNK